MITSIKFGKEHDNHLGLKPNRFHMKNLSKVVVLTGANGSGKTRYFSLIDRVIKAFNASIKNYSKPRKDILRYLEGVDNRLKAESGLIAKNTHIHEEKMKRYHALLNMRESINHTLFEGYDKVEKPIKHINFKYGLRYGYSDPKHMNFSQATNSVVNIKSMNFESLFQQIHLYLYKLSYSSFMSKHPDWQKDPNLRKQSKKSEDFNKLLSLFLNTKLDYKALQSPMLAEPIIFNRPFNGEEISQGQRILLSWLISLFEQSESYSETIIFIDEPELHTHPDAIVQALTSFRDDVLGEHGQIWIATHSVPIITFAGTESLYLVEDGKIEYAGNKIDKVMNRLLGGDNGRLNLIEMLADADQVGFCSFAANCLTAPGVADEKDEDFQQTQFCNIAMDKAAKGEELKILEFGAGKGRMAYALGQEKNKKEYKGCLIKYYAYDPGDQNKDQCIENLMTFYGAGEKGDIEKYYTNDIRELTAAGGQRFHAIVMCNVFHEIPYEYWIRELKRIEALLEEDGVLIIMEDQRMRLGEMPHKKGFIVFDQIGLINLFNDTERKIKLIDSQKKGRLTAFEIPKPLISNATTESIIRALDDISQKAMDNIEKMRAGVDTSSRAGRKHAFHCMQYTNAKLALKQFTGSS